jgi:hypothetical protein
MKFLIQKKPNITIVNINEYLLGEAREEKKIK